MKILHVNTDESQGGAARAAHRLYAGQRSIGADARMVVLRKSSKDPNVDAVPMNRLQRLIRRKTLQNDRPDATMYPGYHGMVWSTGRISTPVPAFIARTLPDVVNLHWLGNGFVSVDKVFFFTYRRLLVWIGTIFSVSTFVFVLTSPRPRADITISPTLDSCAPFPVITVASSFVVLIVDDAPVPLNNAIGVLNVTLSFARISF